MRQPIYLLNFEEQQKEEKTISLLKNSASSATLR